MGGERSEQGKEITLSAALISHIGCVRGNNEDNFYFDGDLMEAGEVNAGVMFQVTTTRNFHLLSICDGMGGLEGGERASLLAVKRIRQLNRPVEPQKLKEVIDDYAIKTSIAIHQDGSRKDSKAKEGTTLAMAYISEGMAHVANVGDSRVYLMRNGMLTQISTDHTEIYRKMLAGQLTREEARKDPAGNVIENYLGMPANKISRDFVAHRNCPLCNGDRMMICSDGVSDLLPHERMEYLLANNASPMDAVQKIIMEALEMGGKDNATLIVADISGASLPMVTPASMEALTRITEVTETLHTAQ